MTKIVTVFICSFMCLLLVGQDRLSTSISVSDTVNPQDRYDYYQNQFDNATNTRNAGMGITIAGLVVTSLGLIIIASSSPFDGGMTGGYLFIAGSLAAIIGIPIWISGGVKRKNNKEALEELQQESGMYNKHPRLYLGMTSNGIGLTLKF